MLRNPFAESVVIISCHNENENINEVDLLFHFLGVVVNYLPSKPESNKKSNQGNSWKDEEYMREHLARHWSNTVLSVIEIVNTFKEAVRPNHVEGAEGKIEWWVFLFKFLLVFLILFVIYKPKGHENYEENKVEDGEIVFVFAEVATGI